MDAAHLLSHIERMASQLGEQLIREQIASGWAMIVGAALLLLLAAGTAPIGYRAFRGAEPLSAREAFGVLVSIFAIVFAIAAFVLIGDGVHRIVSPTTNAIRTITGR
jgi:hypothetical protein